MTYSVDEQVTFFNHAILNLFEQSVPLCRGVRRPNVNPWFDIYIEQAIIDRNLAHRAWRSHGTAESWELYKRFWNRVHCIVRQAKRSYMGRFLDPTLPPKILWKNLDSIGVRDKNFAPFDICPDRMNSLFTSSSNVRPPTVQRSTGNFVPPTRSFAFSNVNSRDVLYCHSSDKFKCYWSGWGAAEIY
jgi:hypothetical protein